MVLTLTIKSVKGEFCMYAGILDSEWRDLPEEGEYSWG